MVQKAFLIGACSLVLLLNSCTKEVERYNIVMFLVDDMGWQDTSVPFWTERTAFNDRYHTPNMERLAAQGMKFTNAYASSVCSPTRVSLMTGMNAAKHRVTNWTLQYNTSTDSKNEFVNTPNWNVNGFSNDPATENAVIATSLAEVLRNNDYRTIHAGKAHFGAIGTPCSDPANCGFDVNIAGHAAGAPASYQGLDNFGNDENGKAKSVWSVPGLEKFHGQDINLTEALTIESLNAVENALDEDKNFFLYLAHYGIHTPIQEDHRFFQKYINDGLDSTEAKYASMIESMDHSLGSIIDYLKNKKIDDETIILFMSDNGGLSALARGGEKHSHNYPLSSGKGSALEGGIRVPMIVKWPGLVAESSVSDAPVIIEDFFPSILEMARINGYNTQQEVDGQSFIPFLKGAVPAEDRALFWHYPNVWGASGPGIGPYSAVRKGDWKLIYFHASGGKAMYNLKEDISEKKNLLNSNREKSLELSKLLGDYLASCQAQMPTKKEDGKLVAYPQ